MKKFIIEETQRVMAEKDLLNYVQDVLKTNDLYHLLGKLTILKDWTIESIEANGYDFEFYCYYTYYLDYMEKIIEQVRKSL